MEASVRGLIASPTESAFVELLSGNMCYVERCMLTTCLDDRE